MDARLPCTRVKSHRDRDFDGDSDDDDERLEGVEMRRKRLHGYAMESKTPNVTMMAMSLARHRLPAEVCNVALLSMSMLILVSACMKASTESKARIKTAIVGDR